MRLREILIERPVTSTWIVDLTFQQQPGQDKEIGKYNRVGTVVMKLNNGRSYVFDDMPWSVYRNWRRSKSKGRYWHRIIKGNYQSDKKI